MPQFNTVAERDAYYAQKLKNAGVAPAINPESSSVTYNQNKTAGDGSWINSRKPSTVTQPTNTQTTQTTQTQAQNPVVPTDTRTDAQKAADLAKQDEIDIRAQEESGRAAQNKLAKELGLAETPLTIEEIVAKQKANDATAKTDLQRQLDYQRSVDQAQQARFNEQAKGAIGATTAAYAQGREGAMAGGASSIRNEFTAETNKQIEENRLRLTEAQAQRDSLMTQLDQAQRDGETKLAESLSKSLSQAKQQIELNKTNYMNALTTANEQARLAEQSTQQAVTTFTGLVDKGTVMSPETIVSMANTLKIPFETAYGYYSGADAIRQDKSLTAQEKAIKLQDTAMDFQERIQGIRSDEAKSVADYTKLVKSGLYNDEELSSFASAMKISSANNPLYQIDLRMKEAEAKKAEFEAKYLGKEPPRNTKEWYDYKQAQLDLEKSQFELNELKGIPNETGAPEYDISNVKDTRLVKGGASNGSGRVNPLQKLSGYSIKSSKLLDADGNAVARVTANYGDNNGRISGETNHNAIDVVFNNGDVKALNGGTIVKTGVSPNTYGGYVWVADKDGNLIQYGHMNVSQVNNLTVGTTLNVGDTIAKHETNSKLWGLASGAHTDIRYVGQATAKEPQKVGTTETTYNKFYKQAISNGLSKGKGKEADKWAIEQTKAQMEAGESKAIPSNFKWASTIINNTFGTAEGGKAAARKNDELATAIESGDGKSAKNIVYNAVLSGTTASERRAFADAEDLDNSYSKVQDALADFKQAGLDTGLVGNTMSDIYKNLTIKRPDEAVRLKTRLEQSFNAYRKAITGAGASEGELKTLAESVPTFSKNLDEIQTMTDMAQADAKDKLDRTTQAFSRGAFDTYDEFKQRMNSLQNLDEAKKQESFISSIQDFAKGLINDHADATGEYVIPEDHKINKYEY